MVRNQSNMAVKKTWWNRPHNPEPSRNPSRHFFAPGIANQPCESDMSFCQENQPSCFGLPGGTSIHAMQIQSSLTDPESKVFHGWRGQNEYIRALRANLSFVFQQTFFLNPTNKFSHQPFGISFQHECNWCCTGSQSQRMLQVSCFLYATNSQINNPQMHAERMPQNKWHKQVASLNQLVLVWGMVLSSAPIS